MKYSPEITCRMGEKKIFANYLINKRLIFRIYKELQKLSFMASKLVLTVRVLVGKPDDLVEGQN